MFLHTHVHVHRHTPQTHAHTEIIFVYLYILTVIAETRRRSGEFIKHLTLIEGSLSKRKSKGGIGGLGYVKRYFVLNNISLLYSKNSDDKNSQVC